MIFDLLGIPYKVNVYLGIELDWPPANLPSMVAKNVSLISNRLAAFIQPYSTLQARYISRENKR
jgi:hypothetical protein